MTPQAEYSRLFSTYITGGTGFPFWKGRVALYAILRALHIGPGDEVIVPGYTCVMNVNPILYVGARPKYADIDPDNYNLTLASVKSHVTDRTRAVIAQHTYGFPAPIVELLDYATRRGIHVIEDCCLALGSTCQGRLLGSFGVASYFSSQWSKPYTTGLGGMAVVNSTEVSNALASLCTSKLEVPHWRDSAQLSLQWVAHRVFVYPTTTSLATRLFRLLALRGWLVGSSQPAEFHPHEPYGFFKGMTAFQARVGIRRLREIDRNCAHRAMIADLYRDMLHDHNRGLLRAPSGDRCVLVRYPVRVADKQAVLRQAAARGYEVGSWFECPLHPMETPLHEYGYVNGMCPVAEDACAHVVNLPVHSRVSVRTALQTARFIAGFRHI